MAVTEEANAGMFSKRRFLVALGGVIASATASPSDRTIKRQSIAASSPFDHSYIGSFTALGDSYSVGLGAGHAMSAEKGIELNADCYQYTGGYPLLLNTDGFIGANSYRNFQYFGCSGALSTDIATKQVPKMQKSQLVTLSAGGNDATLAAVLNYCVYQWNDPWFTHPWWNCDSALSSANDSISNADYTKNLQSLMTAIVDNLIDNNSRVYWVAYTEFWNTDTTECDSVTWSFTVKYGYRQFLTQARRTAMNNLVTLVNSKIKAVCDATPQCVYVDPSADMIKLKGQYCEPGVDESYSSISGGASMDREETWFYEWGTTKDDDTSDEGGSNSPDKRSGIEIRNDTPGNYNNVSFEGAIANYIALGQKDQLSAYNSSSPDLPDMNAQGSLLPDKYGRVFHNDKYTNGIIAMNILKAMDIEQGKMMNEPLVTTTISACTAAVATPTTTLSSTSTQAPSSTQAPPYAPTGNTGANQVDKCHIHVWEYWTCGGDAINLSASIQMWDAAGHQMFAPTPGPDDTPESINADQPGNWTSALESTLVVTGEHQGDYVQFTLGTESWTSKDNDVTANAYCSTGGWDPRGGPSCGRFGLERSTRQMDCYFACPWHGGASSDQLGTVGIISSLLGVGI